MKKYNKSMIMKRAWEIKKEDDRNVFSACLKMAWAEAKATPAADRIAELEALGFKRWTKGGHDRLYINATDLGLEVKFRRTGSIEEATFCGEYISNRYAGKYYAAKTYIDLHTNKVYSAYDELAEVAARIAKIA